MLIASLLNTASLSLVAWTRLEYSTEPELVAIYSSTSPTIDGTLRTSEWQDTTRYTISLTRYLSTETIEAWLYIKHNETHINLGLLMWSCAIHDLDEFVIVFDEGDDGGYGSGTRDYVLTPLQEDLKVWDSNHALRDGFYDNDSWYAMLSEIDFAANATYETDHPTDPSEIEYREGYGWVDAHWECEFSVPFVGHDGGTTDVSDLVCTTEDIIGLKIQYFNNPGANNYYYPEGNKHQISTYASLSFIGAGVRVPYQGQGDTGWCGPTSLAMILHYYGYMTHSWDYAERCQLPHDSGVSIPDMADYVDTYYPSLSTKIGSYWTVDNIMLNDIKSNITSGYPVIIKLIKLTGSHYIVACDFNESGLFVNDPSGALFEDYLGLTPSDPNYPNSLIHAFVDWDDLKWHIATKWWLGVDSLLAVQANPHEPPISWGTIWIFRYGADIIFSNPDGGLPARAIEHDQGLRWVDVQKDSPNNVIPEAAHELYVKVACSNGNHYTESFYAHLYLLSGDIIVQDFGSDSMLTLPAFSYNIPPLNNAFSWNVQDMTGFLETKKPYRLEIDLYNSEDDIVDIIRTPVFYWKLAPQSVENKEPNQHLYLHVYDGQGRHVGVNYGTNKTELGIPDAFYYDDWNGTTTIILPEISNLTIVVDAKYAEEPIEPYNLTVTLNSDAGNYTQNYPGSIAMEETQAFATEVSETSLTLYRCPIHNINADNVINCKTIIGQGYSCLVEAEIVNNGNYTETFNVTAYANTVAIEMQSVTLTSRNSVMLIFMWNTSSFAKGNYTISVFSEPVLGEMHTADNFAIDGWVLVTISGDANGDRICDMADISLLIDHFLEEPYSPANSNFDINCDDVIDMADISIAIDHFLEQW
jgi:hypothetical protein